METETKEPLPGWVMWIVVAVIVVLLMLLIAPMLQVPRGSPPYRFCMYNQKQIMLVGLYNYHEVYGRFPPACVTNKEGKPLYSGRVLILPFIEEGTLYKEFHLDEPWDSSHNETIAKIGIHDFTCCSSQTEESGMTHHVFVTGPGTVWDGDKVCTLNDISYPDQTLILIEVADPGIRWAEPKDVKIDAIDPSFLDAEGNFRSNHPGYVIGAFADGHVEIIPQEKVLEALQKWSQVKQEKRKESVE